MADLARLSLNTITVRQWTLAQCIEGCARHGIPGIAPWRDKLQELGVDAAGYAGLIEVEIMSDRDWWTRDGDEVLRTLKERFLGC